jgi:hypothetical protein
MKMDDETLPIFVKVKQSINVKDMPFLSRGQVIRLLTHYVPPSTWAGTWSNRQRRHVMLSGSEPSFSSTARAARWIEKSE